MAISVRPWTDSAPDLGGLGKVWSLTYRSGAPWEPGPTAELSDLFAAWDGDEVVGGYGVLPMTCTRGEALFQCGGVFAVATAPHLRKAGVGKAMMRQLVHDYRERGFELASLYAFSEEFYRKFGYETCGHRFRITAEALMFPRVESALKARVLSADEYDLIRPCYEAFAHQRSGFNTRPNGQWERILPEDSNKTVYAVGGPIEGYLILQHKVDFWIEQTFDEVVWTTPRAHDALLSIMGNIGINKTKLTWCEPSDSRFRAKYWHRGAELAATGPIMYRVLNVPKALEGLKPDASGEFVLEVRDDLVPENNGPWHVMFSPEGVSVTPLKANAGLSLDIRQFAQAFLGEPSLESLIRVGLVDVHEAGQARAACQLLTPMPVMCADFF